MACKPKKYADGSPGFGTDRTYDRPITTQPAPPAPADRTYAPPTPPRSYDKTMYDPSKPQLPADRSYADGGMLRIGGLPGKAKGRYADGGMLTHRPLNVIGGLREAIVDPLVQDWRTAGNEARQLNRQVQQDHPVAYQAAQMHPAVGIPTAGLNYADAMDRGDTGGAIAASLSAVPVLEKTYAVGNALARGAGELIGGGARRVMNRLGMKAGAGEQAAESLEAGYQQGQQFADGGILAGIGGIRRSTPEDGGMMVGPGTGTSDSIPVILPDGKPGRFANEEAVLPADTVRKIGGPKAIQQLIDATHTPVHSAPAQRSFSTGGMVGTPKPDEETNTYSIGMGPKPFPSLNAADSLAQSYVNNAGPNAAPVKIKTGIPPVGGIANDIISGRSPMDPGSSLNPLVPTQAPSAPVTSALPAIAGTAPATAVAPAPSAPVTPQPLAARGIAAATTPTQPPVAQKLAIGGIAPTAGTNPDDPNSYPRDVRGNRAPSPGYWLSRSTGEWTNDLNDPAAKPLPTVSAVQQAIATQPAAAPTPAAAQTGIGGKPLAPPPAGGNGDSIAPIAYGQSVADQKTVQRDINPNSPEGQALLAGIGQRKNPIQLNGSGTQADQRNAALQNAPGQLMPRGTGFIRMGDKMVAINSNNNQYTAADGTKTNDWTKTADYADGVRLAAKDRSDLSTAFQKRLASGDLDMARKLATTPQEMAQLGALETFMKGDKPMSEWPKALAVLADTQAKQQQTTIGGQVALLAQQQGKQALEGGESDNAIKRLNAQNAQILAELANKIRDPNTPAAEREAAHQQYRTLSKTEEKSRFTVTTEDEGSRQGEMGAVLHGKKNVVVIDNQNGRRVQQADAPPLQNGADTVQRLRSGKIDEQAAFKELVSIYGSEAAAKQFLSSHLAAK